MALELTFMNLDIITAIFNTTITGIGLALLATIGVSSKLRKLDPTRIFPD